MWNWTENQIELYLIRHGMTLGNVEHRYIGRQTDEPLSEDGRQQLEKSPAEEQSVLRRRKYFYAVQKKNRII